ncbi:MAG: ABC transporter permease [Bacteroidota bacterium]
MSSDKQPFPQPPKWADRFLEWFCRPDLLEEIQGDVYELFDARCQKIDIKAAKRQFVWDVLRSFRPSTTKNIFPIMLKNNVKIAFRQMNRQKFYTGINIVGLALGIACCLLIALYIKEELSYDQQHPNVENLYRVYREMNLPEFKGNNNAIPPVAPVAMVEEIPEVTQYARLNPYFGNAGTNLVRKISEQANKFEKGFVYADPSLFEMFHLPLLEGDLTTILAEPNTIVITQKIAQKYFPNQSAIGQTLVLNDDEANQSFRITGVAKDLPRQMHFQYDFFISMRTLADSEQIQWVANNYYGYVTVKEGTDMTVLNQKLQTLSDKYFIPAFKENQLDLNLGNGNFYRLRLQPVTDIHLYAQDFKTHLKENGDIRYVRLFAVIAFFIFVIALVNFVNLSTARSANRAKEVGVRKVLGSMKGQLVSQFLVESVMMSLIAFLIGSVIAYFFLPFFNQLSGKELTIPFMDWTFLPLFLLLSIGAGLVAGLYPSFYLSAFEPIKVLKGKLSRGAKSGWLRNGLVIGQFAISIGLIVATIVVYQQMQFIQNKKLGFEKDQVLLIQDTYVLDDKKTTFKKALQAIPEVKNASMSSYLPLEGGNRNSIVFYTNDDKAGQTQLAMQMWRVDEDYINTLGMNLVEGRNFEPTMATDSQAVILNQRAVEEFGLVDPIGKKVRSPFMETPITVIGVVEDFNFESLKGEIESLGLFLAESNSVISVKANGQNMENLITKVEGLWKTMAPNKPFRYSFLDDRFAKMYVTEDRAGKLFGTFSILAIFIACLGLFAMATFMTQQRTKEIGVRKVLGASTLNIVFQLSKNFLYLVLGGLIIAAPIAHYQMSRWLNNFEYGIELEWWVFGVAGILVLLIAFLTVGSQSLKAAMANPIKSLKVE